MKTIIIDGGATDGDFTRKYIDLYDKDVINTYYLFEPRKDFNEQLEQLCQTHKNISFFNKCIWIEDSSSMNFYVYGESSSLLHNYHGNNETKSETIDVCKFIKDVSEEDDHLIIKLDVEAAEFFILPQILKDSSIVPRIKKICFEPHIRFNEGMYAEIYYNIRKTMDIFEIPFEQLG